MARVLLLLAALVAAGAGALAGHALRRRHDLADLTPRAARPAPLERAWRAQEAGDGAGLAAALAALRTDPPSETTWRGEVALLEALATGGTEALAEVARTWARTPAGARALWLLVERTPEGPDRERLRAAFAARYPEAWVLQEPDGAGPR